MLATVERLSNERLRMPARRGRALVTYCVSRVRYARSVTDEAASGAADSVRLPQEAARYASGNGESTLMPIAVTNRKAFAAACALVLFAGTAAIELAHYGAAPDLESMTPTVGTVVGQSTLVRPGGHGSRGTYGVLRLDRGTVRIEDLCYLSACDLPAAVAELRPGDQLILWLRGNDAWQIERDGRPVVSYGDVVSAYEEMRARRRIIEAVVLITGAAAIALVFFRRRPVRTSVKTSFTFHIDLRQGGAGEPGKISVTQGKISVEERLRATGLEDEFKQAFRAANREALIAIFSRIEIPRPAIEPMVDAILRHRTALLADAGEGKRSL